MAKARLTLTVATSGANFAHACCKLSRRILKATLQFMQAVPGRLPLGWIMLGLLGLSCASSGYAGRELVSENGQCAADEDCRLVRVFTCAEILGCKASCAGVGALLAVPASAPDQGAEDCGLQPPCTPVCPLSPAVLPGSVPKPPPHPVCLEHRCVIR